VFRLTKALKSYREAGRLNEQINLLGFIDDHVFLTKSGDLGVVLSVSGVDYEGLDGNAIDQYTKRLEAAFKVLDDQCRIYQYLFKRKNPRIPYCEYGYPVVNAAIRNRIAYFKGKAESLYSLTIFYVVVLETAQRERYLRRIFSNSSSNDNGNVAEHRRWSDFIGLLSSKKQIVLVDDEIRRTQAILNQKVSSFLLQVGDFLRVKLLGKQDAFRVLRKSSTSHPRSLISRNSNTTPFSTSISASLISNAIVDFCAWTTTTSRCSR